MLRRVLTEQRRPLLLLAAALAVNVVLYVAVVYPLGHAVADARTRATQAEQARRVAQRDFSAAQNLSTGTTRAGEELNTFYQKVLPRDLSAAQRATYLSLAQLARKNNLRLSRRGADQNEPKRGATLARLTWNVALEGNYEDIRRFIHELETSGTFVVIENLSLGQGRDATSPLALVLQLSTYYRPQNNAS